MSQKIVYRVEVFVSIPLSDDTESPDFPTLEGATSTAFKRDVERTMLACLRRFDYEVDNIELMDYSVEEE